MLLMTPIVKIRTIVPLSLVTLVLAFAGTAQGGYQGDLEGGAAGIPAKPGVQAGTDTHGIPAEEKTVRENRDGDPVIGGAPNIAAKAGVQAGAATDAASPRGGHQGDLAGGTAGIPAMSGLQAGAETRGVPGEEKTDRENRDGDPVTGGASNMPAQAGVQAGAATDSRHGV